MEFMQLEMLVAAVEEGTLRGASTRVLRTQPAVSMALRRLEDEIGMAICVRHDGRRLLTKAGKTLYLYARRLLDLREESLSSLAELRSDSVGSKVGTVRD